MGFTQTLDKPKCIGVGAVQTAVSTHSQGIDGTYAFGHGVCLIDPRQGLYLVRQGQVAARKAQSFQAEHCHLQVHWVHSQRNIRPTQTVRRYPVRVNEWRARVRDGPPHNTRQNK